MLYKRYQLLLSGGQLTAIISKEKTAVDLWQWIQKQGNDVISFLKLDAKGTILSNFVTSPKNIIGVDDIFPDDRIDIEAIEKRKKVWEENQKKKKQQQKR